MVKITMQDMVTLATERAETELLRAQERKSLNRLFKTGDLLVQTVEVVCPDALKTDSELIYDIMDAQESEV